MAPPLPTQVADTLEASGQWAVDDRSLLLVDELLSRSGPLVGAAADVVRRHVRGRRAASDD